MVSESDENAKRRQLLDNRRTAEKKAEEARAKYWREVYRRQSPWRLILVFLIFILIISASYFSPELAGGGFLLPWICILVIAVAARIFLLKR